MKNTVLIIISTLFLSSIGYSQQAQKNALTKESSIETNVKQKQVSIQKNDIREESMEKYKNMEQYRQEHNVPDDFPRYKDTGNRKMDLDRYYKAKQKWIKRNPERFELIKNLNL